MIISYLDKKLLVLIKELTSSNTKYLNNWKIKKINKYLDIKALLG